MSDIFKIQVRGPGHDGFTVKVLHGCRLVFGAVPLSEFAMMNHGFSDKAIVAIDLANCIGAALVIGEPDDIEYLRALDLPVSERRHEDYLAAQARGLVDVAMWLRLGERGSSSEAMCKRIFGLPAVAGTGHPHDPDDLARCLKFVEATDSADKVALMRDVSPQWSRLVDVWERLVESLRREMQEGTTAPETYALLQQALK